MKIIRAYEPLSDHIRPGKVLVIYGPRRVGKTTLVRGYAESSGLKVKYITGDDLPSHAVFGRRSVDELTSLVSGYELLVIDEAQDIPSIGHALKIIVDHVPDLRVVVTGSSSFYLKGQVGEPLTGRKETLILYPISQLELQKHFNAYELDTHVNDRLVYGSYPEVVLAPSIDEKKQILSELVGSYLLKDILALDNLKSSQTIYDMLKLLAYQVGSLVSHHELAQTLNIDARTVKRYLDLFEQAYIIVRLGGWSQNLRSEINRKSKYYFVDLGIRNSLIQQYQDITIRIDKGALWENFLLIERLKRNAYLRYHANPYFWRLYSGTEVDYVEEREGVLSGYEFKYHKHVSVPRLWQDTYPHSTYTLLTRANYRTFVT